MSDTVTSFVLVSNNCHVHGQPSTAPQQRAFYTGVCNALCANDSEHSLAGVHDMLTSVHLPEQQLILGIAPQQTVQHLQAVLHHNVTICTALLPACAQLRLILQKQQGQLA